MHTDGPALPCMCEDSRSKAWEAIATNPSPKRCLSICLSASFPNVQRQNLKRGRRNNIFIYLFEESG